MNEEQRPNGNDLILPLMPFELSQPIRLMEFECTSCWVDWHAIFLLL